MPAKHIVDSRLFTRLDASDASEINNSFAQNTNNKAHLASQLLLYDKIIIPTIDFGIVPALVSWLGINDFIAAIDSDSIQFLRRDGILAYNGGLGISLIRIEKGDAESFEWWQEALFSNDEISLEFQITNRCSEISKRQQKTIISKVLEKTDHLSFPDGFFIENVVNESYRDIIKSPSLSELVKKYGKKGPDGSVNLERLKEVPSNKTRILRQDAQLIDIADLVLRVAEINMELSMATQTENADLFTSTGAENILRQKLIRNKMPQRLLNGFIKLLDLSRIPDIRPAIAKGKLSIQEIWRVRASKTGNEFRKWLREADPRSARDLERAYVEALGKSSLSDSLPVRTIRFAITSIAGLINPAIDLGTSVIDSFFLDKWLRGYSPKLLLDELQKLTISKKQN